MSEKQMCNACEENEAKHFCRGCDDEPCDCGDDDGEWGVCDDCNSDDGDEYVCNYHRPYAWDMMDAFSKFGNEDGNRYHTYTHFISNLLEKNGYEVETDSWGMHNSCVIMSIKKDDKEIYGEEISETQIVKTIKKDYIENIRKIVEGPFNIGYDNPFLVLPDEIKTLLKNAVESQEWIDAGCTGLGNSLWYNDVRESDK
jgi:hypothetical protein